MMAQEEQNQRGSTGSSGGGNAGKSSKKQKQKKVPQRGLGVAQLEKIRIEELKKKDAVAAMATTAISPPPPPTLLISQGTVPLVNHHGKGSDVLPGAIMMSGKTWSSVDLRPELETPALDTAFARCPNWSSSGESDQVWPPGPIPRVKLEYLNQVIVPSAPTPSQSSTLLNFQMEPPSNQNYHHNSYTQIVHVPEVNLLKREVIQVVGMKRACPFTHENPPPPPPPPLRLETAHHTRLNESISHGGGNRLAHDLGSGNFRSEYQETLSFSGSSSTRESNLTRGSRENGILGEVLTLAPPSTSSTRSNPKMVDPLPALSSNNQNIFLDHDLPHLYQGRFEELSSFPQGSRNAGQQHNQYYYSFIPPAVPQDTRVETETRTRNGEDRECIDLELRL